jgi:superfamily II DNA or RNA helicase/phage anti-repressor protein
MTDNQQNYLKFEHYCINKHIKDFNHTTYHWSVIPDTVLIESGYFNSESELRLKRKNNNQVLKEYGLDGISIEHNEEKNIYHGLQMKLWNNTICANDLGTFISVIFSRFSNESKGYLYHISKLEKTLKNDIIKRNKIVEIKTINPFTNNNEEINNYSIKLRPYQIEAINKLKEIWNGIKLLYLPCGTGKTIIFCEYLKIQNFKNIFIFSPLTMLTEQNLDNIKNYLPNYNHILVDVNGTRDFNVIKDNLNKYSVFSSTFKSAEEVIYKIFNIEEDCVLSEDTILIVDEAHNLLNLDKLNNIVQKFNKVLLVTATPPTKMEEIIPHEIIYKYSFTYAIKEGYICDYLIYLPFVENNKVIMEKPEELITLDEDICKKCLFLINGLLRTGCRRTIIYLKCKDECELYQYVLNYIMNNYHYYKINIKKITSETNKKDRVDILSWFEKESNEEELKIILSIRILDEGINLIKCDSIYLTNLGDNSNDVRTVQRFLRANRIDPNNLNKIAHIFIWCEDTNLCLNTFQMLKNNDIDFNKKIRVFDNNYGRYYKDVENKISNINKYDINNEIIKNINIKCLTVEELWQFKKNLLFEYCDLYKTIPLENIVYKNQKIGFWYKSQRIKIKNNLNNNRIIYNEFIQNIYVKDDLLKYTDNKIVEKVNVIEEQVKNDKIICFMDFLKKNSTISCIFLEDYYKIIDNKNIDEISIDLETVITWLDINKHKAKETLIKTYIKDIDYKIKKIFKPNGIGGQKKEIIMISVSCFKKMCLLTKSVRGNEVREYFVKFETLINKYSHYIINALKDI